MSDGIKAEPSYIGGIIVWKIINLKTNEVIAEGPTINEAVRKIQPDVTREEVEE